MREAALGIRYSSLTGVRLTVIRNTLIGLSLALLATTGTLEAQAGGRLRDLIAKRMGDSRSNAPQSQPGETIAYGNDAAQQLSFWPAQGASGRAPLVLFVHGGGWSRGSRDNAARGWKQVHFPARGYAFASIDYRLVPQATVEEQAGDIAAAVRALVDRADSLGIDRHRIVLMGHSAGAHLVAQEQPSRVAHVPRGRARRIRSLALFSCRAA